MKKQIMIFTLFAFAAFTLNAQSPKVSIPLIGDDAPSFKAQSTTGKINFPKDFGDSWKIIFSHPKDFTPVCSSEILELAHLQDQFKKINTSLMVLSTDILSQHETWVAALEEVDYKDRGTVKIEFPLIDDSDYSISAKYGMIHPAVHSAQNVRAVFVIDPENKVRSISFYPLEMGRNMDEIKRSVVALQRIDREKTIATPANWNPGDHVIVPVLTSEEKDNLGSPDSEIIQKAWFLNFKPDKID